MNKILVSLAVAASAVPMLVAGAAKAQTPATPEPYFYGPHMGWSGGWDGMVFGPLLMVLVLAAVVGLTWMVARRPVASGNGTSPAAQGRTPLDILKERFARGEIDKADFEERRRVLGE